MSLGKMQLANGGMFWLWEDCCRPYLSHITQTLYKCYFISGHYVFGFFKAGYYFPYCLEKITSFISDKPLMGLDLSCWASSRLYVVSLSVPMRRIRCLQKMAIWWKPNSPLTATSCLCCCGNLHKNGKTAERPGFCGNCWLLLFLSLELI